MLFLAEYDFYIEILCSKRLDIYIYFLNENIPFNELQFRWIRILFLFNSEKLCLIDPLWQLNRFSIKKNA